MKRNATAVGCLAALGLLAACGPSNDAVYTQFFRPAGDIVDNGAFGRANQNNIGVHTGQESFVLSLANRFTEEVPSTVNFAFDQAVLDENARAVLREQARWILQFPEARFRVYGHTDAVGSNAYNKALGLRRARAVVNYLVSQGIDRSRLQAVASFGETQPVVATSERERRNRRTVTEVSGFVRNHPLVLDGKYAQIVYRDYVASAEAESQLRTIDDGQIQAQE